MDVWAPTIVLLVVVVLLVVASAMTSTTRWVAARFWCWRADVEKEAGDVVDIGWFDLFSVFAWVSSCSFSLLLSP